jgi:hypothetical protein
MIDNELNNSRHALIHPIHHCEPANARVKPPGSLCHTLKSRMRGPLVPVGFNPLLDALDSQTKCNTLPSKGGEQQY